jgi:hypothetical protein
MSVLVVGGDRLGNIPQNLSNLGFDCVKHISGRKCKNCQIVNQADLVLVLTDYIGHNLCEDIKSKAKSSQVKTLFCRRSWSCIYKKMQFCGLIN